MNHPKNNTITTDTVSRTMRELLLDAPSTEVDSLAREAGLNPQDLAQTGRNLAREAVQRCDHSSTQRDNIVLLHKGLNSLLVMLRRRDSLDEGELAKKAEVDEDEIRRIEYDPNYLPSPRTIYRLEKTFSLPSGVLAKLSGAIKFHSPVLEERAVEFAANAKTIGKLTKAERDLLNDFVKFLTQQS